MLFIPTIPSSLLQIGLGAAQLVAAVVCVVLCCRACCCSGPQQVILTCDWSPDITILTSDWPGPAPAPGPGEERGAAAGDRAERRAGEVEHGGAGVQRVQEVDREIVDSRQSPMKQYIIGNKEIKIDIDFIDRYCLLYVSLTHSPTEVIEYTGDRRVHGVLHQPSGLLSAASVTDVVRFISMCVMAGTTIFCTG